MTNTLLPRPRRGRPPTISDEELLEAARAVFLARGIRATTAEVAARANVSEGTLFHRYKTKDALFGAAMSFDPNDLAGALERIVPTPDEQERDLRGSLVTFGLRYVELTRVVMPMMMMGWSSRNALDVEALKQRRSMKMRLTRVVKPIFDAAMSRGELADVNSSLLVRMYVGSLRDYCMSELFDDAADDKDPLDPHTVRERTTRARKMVEQLVTLILRAAAP